MVEGHPRPAEEPEASEFAWPPAVADTDIWDLDACPLPPPAEFGEPPLTIPTRSSNPIPLLSCNVALEWQHAVALVQQLGEQLKDTAASQRLLELDAIDLEATGRLSTKLDPGTIPIVRSLGHVLHLLLTDHPGPASVRLIALQASCETPSFASVDDLVHALAKYQRSDRLRELSTLYERAVGIAPAVAAPTIEAHREASQTAAFMAWISDEAAKWWRQVPRWTEIAGLVAGIVCIALMGFALALHESGPSTPMPQPAVKPQIAGQNIAEPNVTERDVQRPTPSPESRSSVSREGAQRRQPYREDPKPANIQSPTSTRIPQTAEGEFRRARELLDRKDYAAAADGFQRVITILSAGELSPLSSTLRRTATEMVAVSRASLAPVPSPRTSLARNEGVVEPAPVRPSLPAQPVPEVSPDQHVYVAGDEGVIEPSPLKQYIPPQPAPGVLASDLSVLELLIDNRGAVETVHLRSPKNRYRDGWWVSAAKAWQFRPALKDGQPVKFLKLVSITTFVPSDPQ